MSTSRKVGQHQHGLAIAGVVLVLGVCFWPVLSGRRSLVPTDVLHQLILPYGAGVTNIQVQNHYTMDVITQFYPAYDFFVRCIQSAQLPLWNPYVLCGHPIFAVSTYSFANPFNFVFWLLPMPVAFDLRIVLQFAVAAIFMYALLWHWRLAPAACALGALAYSLNSQFLFAYWHGQFNAFVWMPLVILFFDRSCDLHFWPNATFAGVLAGAAILAGNIQSAAYVPVTVLFYGTARFCFSRHKMPARKLLAALTVVSIIGALVGAVQLIPSAELITQDERHRLANAWGSGSFRQGLMCLPLLATFVVPGLWGSTETFDLMKTAHTSAAVFQGYIGVAPILLLALAVATNRRPEARALAVCAVVVLVLLLFAPPVRQVFYFRFLVAWTLPAAALAAFGLDFLLRKAEALALRRSRRVAQLFLVFLIAVAVGLLGIHLIWAMKQKSVTEFSRRWVEQRSGESVFGSESQWLEARVTGFWTHFRLTNVEFLIPLACGVAAVCLVLWCAKRRPPTWCGLAFVVLAAVDLLPLARRTIPMVDKDVYPLYPVTPQIERLRQSAIRVAQINTPGRSLLPDNMLMVYGISTPTGVESLFPLTSWDVATNRNGSADELALGVMSVSHVLRRVEEKRDAPSEDVGGLQFSLNPAAEPRARFVTSYVPVAGKEKAQQPFRRGERSNLIETTRPPSAKPGHTTTRILADSPTRLQVEVTTDTEGFLLLADTFYPGWLAEVDGKRTEICRANITQRAVFVDAGTHRVVFRYAPLSVHAGATITGVTLLFCAGVWIVSLRNGRRLRYITTS